MDRNFVIIGVDTGFHVRSVPRAVLHGSQKAGIQPRRLARDNFILRDVEVDVQAAALDSCSQLIE
jgi:hypothetical protein